MRHARVLAIAAVAAAATLAFAETPGEVPPEPALRPDGSLVVMQWNVENLYDFEDDLATTGDDAFSPGGWFGWNEGLYWRKLTNVAEVVGGLQPDILCLEEVENSRVLRDLRAILSDAFGWEMRYVVHRESHDPRGLDCAMLSRIKPTKAKWIYTGQALHESPCIDLVVDGRPLVVICNHWKSRTGNSKISAAKREVQADRVRDEYRKRLAADASLAILVTGDFNDRMNDRVPLECGPFRTNQVEVLEGGDSLFCLSALLPEGKRDTFYFTSSKSWFSFDTMNVSRGLLPEGVPASPWVVDFASYRVVDDEKLRLPPSGMPFPFREVRSGKERQFFYGYSDHFPVVVTLRPRKGN